MPVAQQRCRARRVQRLAAQGGLPGVAKVQRQLHGPAVLQHAGRQGQLHVWFVITGGKFPAPQADQGLPEAVLELSLDGHGVALAGAQPVVHVDVGAGVLGGAHLEPGVVDADGLARGVLLHRVGEAQGHRSLGIAVLDAGQARDAKRAISREVGGVAGDHGQGTLHAGEALLDREDDARGERELGVDHHVPAIATLHHPGLDRGVEGDVLFLEPGGAPLRGLKHGQGSCADLQKALHLGWIHRLVEVELHPGVRAQPARAAIGPHPRHLQPRGGELPGNPLAQRRAVQGLDPRGDGGRVLRGAGQGFGGLEHQGAGAEPALLGLHRRLEDQRALARLVLHLLQRHHRLVEGDRHLQVGRRELSPGGVLDHLERSLFCHRHGRAPGARGDLERRSLYRGQVHRIFAAHHGNEDQRGGKTDVPKHEDTPPVLVFPTSLR